MITFSNFGIPSSRIFNFQSAISSHTLLIFHIKLKWNTFWTPQQRGSIQNVYCNEWKTTLRFADSVGMSLWCVLRWDTKWGRIHFVFKINTNPYDTYLKHDSEAARERERGKGSLPFTYLYFVSPRERPWRHCVFRRKTLIVIVRVGNLWVFWHVQKENTSMY